MSDAEDQPSIRTRLIEAGIPQTAVESLRHTLLAHEDTAGDDVAIAATYNVLGKGVRTGLSYAQLREILELLEAQQEAAKSALLTYMEGTSELRWSAGWLSDLHLELRGDKAYDWLVQQAGGTFTYRDEFATLEELGW